MKIEDASIAVEGLSLVGRAYWPCKELLRKGEKFPLLILCHGIPRGNPPGSDTEQNEEDRGYPALAERCIAEGLPCFHFNFRGTGESEGNFDLCGWGRDLVAVLDYWEKHNFHQRGFYLWGFSAGAAVSCYVASFDHRVKGVVLSACPAEFKSLFPLKDLDKILSRFREVGIIKDVSFPSDPVAWLEGIHSVNPLAYIARIAPRPLLIVHGTGDELIPCEHAFKLYEQAGDPKQLLIIPGAAHQLRKSQEAVSGGLEWLVWQNM